MSSSMRQCYPWVRFKSIPVGNLLPVRYGQQSAMEEIYETRRIALKQMIESMGRGAITQVANRIGVDPSYVSRLLYEDGKKGKKNIGDEIVTKLDEHYPLWDKTSSKTIVATIKPRSDKDAAIAELVRIAGEIDMIGIGMLIERANQILGERLAKQTASSSA